MVVQQATQGRLRQEHLAQTIARCAAMPSQQNQVQYLRAQLAHREAQLAQVCAERDKTFIEEEEEEVLAHVRLGSEAKDWKSGVVSETEQVFCQKSAQTAQHATEIQEPWINNSKLDGDKLKQNSETFVNPTALKCKLWQSSSFKLQETQLEHQQLYIAQERQLQQTLMISNSKHIA